MKQFKFSLEKYLTYKKFKEKLCMTDLAKVTGRINQHQQSSDRYFSETGKNALIETREMKEGKQDTETIVLYRRYFAQLRKNKEHSDHEIQKMQPALKKEQEKFNLAHRDVRVLEILKEKKHKEYLKKLAQNETQELDEFNQNRKK